MTIRQAKSIFLLPLLLLFFSSCGEEPFYEEYISVNDAGWIADSIASFELEVDDTVSAYRVVLTFRANNDYPHSNLYLFREILSEDGLEYRDTANFILADPYGKWLGDGMGELKTFARLFRRQPLRFNKKGTYRFRLEQAMRVDTLKGIKDIGISIYKEANGKEEN